MNSNLLPVQHRSEPQAAVRRSDEALASACASGDATAVAELFDRFQRPVTRYLLRLVHRDDVEDCLQSTFLEVARAAARYEGRSSVSTWLFGVATNVVRHHRRSTHRRARLSNALSLLRHGSSCSTPVDGVVASRETLERVSRGLASLPPERCQAFVLCALEGLRARDAAGVLGVAETAVWRRVSDARRNLREVLGEAER